MALIGLQAPAMAQDPPRFPAVTGRSLEHRTFHLPADFEADRNLVLVAFKRAQQADVDSWMPFLRPLAHVLLIDRVGQVYWRAEGPFTEGGARNLPGCLSEEATTRFLRRLRIALQT